MSDKKIITVFGATGNQGGSVVSALLSSSTLRAKYAIRAVTRDPSRPNAQNLASKGVDLVKADLNDRTSIETAIKDSYGVFAVTDYWQTTSKDVEFGQGKNIVDASISAGIKHLVWSSLPHAGELTNGELTKVEHFESKADVAKYAEKNKGSTKEGLSVSYFMPAYFMSNLVSTIKPSADDKGTPPTLALPWNATTTHVPLIDIRADTGKYVVGLFEAGPSSADGVAVQGTSEWMTPSQIVETLSRVTGKEVKFTETEMSVETAAKMSRIPEELMQNMLLIRDYSYFGRGAEGEKQKESDEFILGGKGQLVGFAKFAEGAKWLF